MTALGYNVITSTFEGCAKFIFKTVKKSHGMHCVYLSRNGDIAIIPDSENSNPGNPSSELVNRYRKTSPIMTAETIAEDLLERWRDLRPELVEVKPKKVRIRDRPSTCGRVCGNS